MYYTSEYSVLRNNGEGEDIVIKPNTPFNAFEGDYTVTSFARVRDSETNEIVTELAAGQNTKGVGIIPKPKRRIIKED